MWDEAAWLNFELWEHSGFVHVAQRAIVPPGRCARRAAAGGDAARGAAGVLLSSLLLFPGMREVANQPGKGVCLSLTTKKAGRGGRERAGDSDS